MPFDKLDESQIKNRQSPIENPRLRMQAGVRERLVAYSTQDYILIFLLFALALFTAASMNFMCFTPSWTLA